MNARIDPDAPRGTAAGAAAPSDLAIALAAPQTPFVPAAAPFDADADLAHGLPPDHPAWSRDGVSLSQRARALFATLRPIAVKVMHVWDHVVRRIAIGDRVLEVDVSGSYRLP